MYADKTDEAINGETFKRGFEIKFFKKTYQEADQERQKSIGK